VKIFPHHLQVGARRASMQLIQPHPRTMKKTLLAILGLAAVSLAGVNAQVLINNALNFTYTQNFDTLATSGTSNTWTDNSTISNWYSNRIVYIGNNGSSTTGALASLGSTGSTDRALGALSTGTAAPNFAVVFLNNSGSSILLSDIKISYTGEQWRQTANFQTLNFGYQISSSAITDSTSGVYTSSSALAFTATVNGTAGPIDGNLPANQTQFSNISLDTSGSLANGQYLSVRWDKGNQTTSPALGVDDFSLNVVPEPSTWALIGLGSAFVLWRIRRKRVVG
jgi:hypothetical protein